jgi:hypothetical protein
MELKHFDELNEQAKWIICTAIGTQHEKIDQMHSAEVGGLDIHLTVNGVELDFERVAQAIDSQFDEAVRKTAERLALQMKVNKYAEMAALDKMISALEYAKRELESSADQD